MEYFCLGIVLSEATQVQKKTIRIVTSSPIFSHTEPLFKHTGLLTVGEFVTSLIVIISQCYVSALLYIIVRNVLILVIIILLILWLVP